ncbi:hypothetical protein [Caldinitratiruptor microaerophilus]|uniref:hypothetical protein n=1 Tax=Caldinitratiruptor microaerophilus TaxID=671077 RepID=UPI0022310C0F|nr:hypothetical protein [Caldinitratiruptor microaerophilus]
METAGPALTQEEERLRKSQREAEALKVRARAAGVPEEEIRRAETPPTITGYLTDPYRQPAPRTLGQKVASFVGRGLWAIDTPRRALFSAMAASERAERPGRLALTDPEVWRAFGEGFRRGWRGETYGNLFSEAYPEWAKRHPTTAALADFAAAAATPDVAGKVIGAASRTVRGVPQVARLVQRGEQAAEARQMVQGLRLARQRAAEEGIARGLRIGEGLTPEQEQAARRLMERLGPEHPTAPVDVALQRASTPRTFRPTEPLDRLLSRAVGEAPTKQPTAVQRRLEAMRAKAGGKVPVRRPTVDLDKAEAFLVGQYGVEPRVARAAIQGRQLTQQIAREYAKRGIPLEAREAYFPRIVEGRPLTEKLRIAARNLWRGRDPFTKARVVEPELSIDELAKLREAGESVPAYRQDFRIPLAVRAAAAQQRIVLDDYIKQALQRFGRPATGRTVEELAQEGFVAARYSPTEGLVPIKSGPVPEGASVLPKPIFDAMSRYVITFGTDDGAARLAKAVRDFHSFWKRATTLWRFPGFTINNAIGGFVNNIMWGMDPSAYGPALKIAAQRFYRRPLQGVVQTPRGPMTFAEVVRAAEETGALQSIVRDVRGTENLLTEAQQAVGKLPAAKRFGSFVVRSNEAVEDANRLAIFIDRLAKGETPQQAAQAVFRTQFDYRPESYGALENTIREYLIPFWVFHRNNLVLHTTNFLRRPTLYRAYLNAYEQASRRGREERPEWLRYGMPVGTTAMGLPVIAGPASIDPVMSALSIVEQPGESVRGAGGPIPQTIGAAFTQVDPRTQRPFRGPGDVAKFALGAYGGRPGETAQAAWRLATGEPWEKAAGATSLVRQFVPGVYAADPEYNRARNAEAEARRLQDLQRASGRPWPTLQEIARRSPAPGGTARTDYLIRSARAKAARLARTDKLIEAAKRELSKTRKASN